MAIETINGTLQLTRLTNEPAEYVARREELRLAEIELMRHRERVAEMRRRLPPGAVVHDYVFQEGPANLDAGDAPITTVRLSDLFTGPNRSVVIYHLMYGKRQTNPCPMCTMWIDGYNGVGQHIAQNVDFAIAAAGDPPMLRQHARNRVAPSAVAQLRRQHVQVRPSKRGRGRQAGFNHFGLHSRPRRHAAAFVFRTPMDGGRCQGARHRLADAGLQHARSHAAGTR
jgi:Bacterial protein of unknown function (DUF899)